MVNMVNFAHGGEDVLQNQTSLYEVYYLQRC